MRCSVVVAIVAAVAVAGCGAPASAPVTAGPAAPAAPAAPTAMPVLFRQIKSERSLVAPAAVAPYTVVAGAIHIDDRDLPVAGTGPTASCGSAAARSNPVPPGCAGTIDAIAHGFARVPPELRALARGLAISPVDNPTDAAFTEKYKLPIRAGMSANADGDITIYPYGLAELKDESFFVKNLLHELGHTWSLRAWRADRSAMAAWIDAIGKDPSVPSTYAQGSFKSSGSPAEDAAEATALYFIVRGTPDEAKYRAALPARFALIDARFPRG